MAIYAGRFSALKMSTAAGSTALSAVAQLVSFTPPQISNPPVDVTVLESTWRTFIGTMPDGGTASFEILWDQANTDHGRLATLVTGSTPEEWKIVGPTTTKTVFFRGLVSDFSPTQIVVDNVWRASVSIKVDGAVTISS